MIDLYYYTSPNVRKILIALEELGLEYRIRWTDIKNGDQFAPEYLEVNPNSKVPAIVDLDGPDGGPLPVFESGAILLYLAEKAEGLLLPSNPGRRWEAISWLFWQVANQGPMAGQAAHFVSHAPKQGIDDPYARRRYTTEIRRLCTVMDTRLAREDYLAGEFSIADIACYPWVRVAAGHGVDIGQYPHVAAWSARISARPSTKVRVADPREATALRNDYTPEQFSTLFRPGEPSDSSSAELRPADSGGAP